MGKWFVGQYNANEGDQRPARLYKDPENKEDQQQQQKIKCRDRKKTNRPEILWIEQITITSRQKKQRQNNIGNDEEFFGESSEEAFGHKNR